MHLIPIAIAACLTFSVQDPARTKTSVHDAFHAIAQFGNANLVIAPDVTGVVTAPDENTPWRTALHRVAEEAGCTVEESDGVLRISKTQAKPPGPRVMFNFVQADIHEVIGTIAKLSGASIIVDPAIQGRVTVRLRNIEWRQSLEIIASTSGWIVEDDASGIVRITTR